MKTKYPIALLMLGMSVAAVAQEDDDMYFNKKDRATVSEQTELAWAKRNQEEDVNAVRTNPVNPSDSYSGRGVNPEYNAQTKNGTSVVQNEPDYFLPNYQPTNVNSNLYNGGTTANNNYYGNSAYNNSYNNGMGYGGFGSPYGYSPYGGMYSSYGYGYSPYGMMGMGYGMGMGSYMGMGMGMGYGFGSYYGSGMYGGMGYGSMYGMYNPYGYGGYGYPSTIVVVNGDAGIRTVNGRYTSRSSNVNNSYVSGGRNPSVATGSTSRGGVSNGRVATSGTNNYYDRSWKSNTSTGVSRGAYDSNSGSRSNTNTSWGSGSRGTWSGGSGNTGTTSGRSSSWGNGGSGSRSSFGSGTSNSNIGSGSRGSFGGGGTSGGGGGSSSGGGGGGSRGRH